jgi:hypothetical protein
MATSIVHLIVQTLRSTRTGAGTFLVVFSRNAGPTIAS